MLVWDTAQQVKLHLAFLLLHTDVLILATHCLKEARCNFVAGGCINDSINYPLDNFLYSLNFLMWMLHQYSKTSMLQSIHLTKMQKVHRKYDYTGFTLINISETLQSQFCAKEINNSRPNKRQFNQQKTLKRQFKWLIKLHVTKSVQIIIYIFVFPSDYLLLLNYAFRFKCT